jgi:hypothetical protein
MEIKFFKVSPDDPTTSIEVSNPMLVYKISDELPADRNYYVMLNTADEWNSLQYLLIKNGFKKKFLTKDDRDNIVWIFKDLVESVVIVNSHIKIFTFSFVNNSFTTPLNKDNGWGLYAFSDVFELKPEYRGYLSGKRYGL